MLSLLYLKTFVTVAERGHFGRAAEALGISQPTVSQHLAKLETELGVLLIDRFKNGCTLTPDGRKVLSHARGLLRSADRLSQSVLGDAIEIGCSGNIASYFISEALQRFAGQAGPEFNWSVTANENPAVAEKLDTGEIDLAAMEWPDRRSAFHTRVWRRESLVLIVPPGHPAAGDGAVDIGDAVKWPFIGGERGSGTGTLLREVLGERASDIEIAHQFQTTEAVKDAVRSGLGVSLVLSRAVDADLSLGRLATVDIDGYRFDKTFYVSVRSDMAEDAMPVQLANFMVEEADAA